MRSLKRTTQSAASICWPQPLPEYVSVGMTTAQLLHHWGFSWSFAQRALGDDGHLARLELVRAVAIRRAARAGDEEHRRGERAHRGSRRAVRRGAVRAAGRVGAAGRRGAHLGADGREAGAEERRALVEDGDLFRGHRRGSCAREEGVSALFLKRKTRPTRFFCNPLSDRIVSLLYGYSSVVYRLEPNFYLVG